LTGKQACLAEDGSDGERKINGGDVFFAHGAEPAVAAEEATPGGGRPGMRHGGMGHDGAGAAAEVAVEWAANHRLFEVIGKEAREEFPGGAPDEMGVVVGAVAGIEELAVGGKEWDGAAAFAAEAADGGFFELAAMAGVEEHFGRNPQPLGHICGILPADSHRMAIPADRVRPDDQLMLDWLIRMPRMVQIHRMVGHDDPMGWRDPPIRGTNRNTPRPRRPGEGFRAAAGQATMQRLWIGKNFLPQLQPSLANIALELRPQHSPPPF